MDERYYIIGGLALLLLALVAYLFDSIARYRRAVRVARQTAVASDGGGEAKYITDDDRVSELFSPAPAEVPTEILAPESTAPTGEVDPIVGLYDSLLITAEPQSVVTPLPPPVRDESEEFSLFEEPSRVMAAPTPEPEPEQVSPVQEIDETAALIAALEAMAVPEPEPEPTPEPELVIQPGYSVADELERLMDVAESQSTIITSEVYEPTVVPAAPVVSAAAYEEPPLVTSVSVGQALSAPEGWPAAVPVDVTTPAYGLVAPVELHFTGGGGRVGVKQGTRSYEEFQRLAGIMLSDLRAARER